MLKITRYLRALRVLLLVDSHLVLFLLIHVLVRTVKSPPMWWWWEYGLINNVCGLRTLSVARNLGTW